MCAIIQELGFRIVWLPSVLITCSLVNNFSTDITILLINALVVFIHLPIFYWRAIPFFVALINNNYWCLIRILIWFWGAKVARQQYREYRSELNQNDAYDSVVVQCNIAEL
jgi:signal transduction histidine kinase